MATKKGRAKGEGYTFKDNQGRWWARLSYRDVAGKRCEVKRRAESRAAASALLRKLVREFEDQGADALENSHRTFAELADFYEKRYLIPAQYVDGRKVAGLRSYQSGLRDLPNLRSAFEGRKVRSITYSDLEHYKAQRLATPTRYDSQRSIAAVNRELALLRRMLNIALREGWLMKNPFTSGDPLICLADERKRERILTRDEEARLLGACTGRRAHLFPIIVTALDTGMRRGEIFKLRWSDIDFDAGMILVRAFNTKTMRERRVGMTNRLQRILRDLAVRVTDRDRLVFDVADNVKSSFTGVREKAGLKDVRFHDLRHTHATRLVSAHIPLPEVGRVLGHTQANTTYRYVNANEDTARRTAAALNEYLVGEGPAGLVVS